MLSWWRTAPRWVTVAVVFIAALLLAVGAATHVTDLVRLGWTPYPWAPRWLNVYWTSLAFLDTAAAVLLLAGRRTGLDLAMAIVLTDLTANAYAATFIRHANPLAETGVLRIAAFTAVVLMLGPLARPHLTSWRPTQHTDSRRTTL